MSVGVEPVPPPNFTAGGCRPKSYGADQAPSPASAESLLPVHTILRMILSEAA